MYNCFQLYKRVHANLTLMGRDGQSDVLPSTATAERNTVSDTDWAECDKRSYTS